MNYRGVNFFASKWGCGLLTDFSRKILVMSIKSRLMLTYFDGVFE